MRRTLVVVLAAALLVAAKGAEIPPNDPVDLTVHEWGTFTSLAGEDGKAVEWLPQIGPPDLPSFVERVRYYTKGCLSGTVRMETPVLYFYAPQQTSVDVRVRFHRGVVSEWYPQAEVSPRSVSDATLRNAGFTGTAVWNDVQVIPHGRPDFPAESRASHYYAARETDASPIQVNGQTEKFLFYRGVGRFDPPLTVRVADDGTLAVDAIDGETIGDVVLFENRRGRTGYTVHRQLPGHAELKTGDFTGDTLSLNGELERLLVEHGLYQKEAEAMVATWRDAWFEEGTRLFYLLPQATVDRLLPLEIHPAPADIRRVFVGRIEVVTAETARTVRDAIATVDHVTLAKYGRFIRPIADRLLARSSAWERPALEQRLSVVYSRLAPLVGCR